MKRWPIVLLALFVVFAGAGFVAYQTLLAPQDPTAYEPPVSAATREDNALLAAALSAGGIQDPLTEITPERVYVVYELPADLRPAEGDANATTEGDANATAEDANLTAEAESVQRYALGAAGAFSEASEHVVVTQLMDGNPRWTWVVESAMIEAFVLGEIDSEAFEDAILKITFTDKAAD